MSANAEEGPLKPSNPGGSATSRQGVDKESKTPQLPTTFAVAAILTDARSAIATLRGLEALSKLLPAAKLMALHVEVDPSRLVADDEEVGIQRLREHSEGTAHQRAVDVRKAFDSWWHSSGSAGLHTTWRQLDGAEERSVVEATRNVDLVVLARPRNIDASDALHATLFHHHLVLIMPPSWEVQPHMLCRHVAVGWKPCRQVDQALLLSLPCLKAAERVSLLAIDQPTADYSHDHVLRVLREMGIEPRLHRITSGGQTVGRALLEETRRLGADTLVAGAYRHGELIEQIFGGVSQELIEHSEIPVFLAH
jgi:nucleotide-binding universal stress UspA family protein